MANQEHLDILKQGVEVWNQWRKEHLELEPDLRNADLSNRDLSRIDFSKTYLLEASLRKTDLSHALFWKADLHKANLSEANLFYANLVYANLNDADLSRVNLRQADLSQAHAVSTNLSGANLCFTYLRKTDLSRTNLSKAQLIAADLDGANLSWANLSEANLSGSFVRETIFGAIDLSQVKGLDTVDHVGPSIISIDTIYLSQGNISEVFLRGAGISDSFITYARSLIGKPIDFYSCFISYASRDELFTKRLYADLQSNGVRCWFAPEDLKIGDKIRPRIDESIRLYNKLLLVFSEYSVSSQWVEQEVETALEKERKENRTILFPIRLDSAVMNIEGGWPAFIRNTRNIGDFTRWKQHDAYQKAFERLIRDLKAEA